MRAIVEKAGWRRTRPMVFPKAREPPSRAGVARGRSHEPGMDRAPRAVLGARAEGPYGDEAKGEDGSKARGREAVA